jgi:phenylacetic acid degradation operon negative regulatory protein
MLERHELTKYVDIFRGDHFYFGAVDAKVQLWWNLDELANSYREFLTTYRPILKKWRHGTHADAAAFGDYIDMLTTWRRISDPRLPAEVLPRGWSGLPGTTLFGELNELLKARAERHALAVIRRWGANSLPRRVQRHDRTIQYDPQRPV